MFVNCAVSGGRLHRFWKTFSIQLKSLFTFKIFLCIFSFKFNLNFNLNFNFKFKIQIQVVREEDEEDEKGEEDGEEEDTLVYNIQVTLEFTHPSSFLLPPLLRLSSPKYYYSSPPLPPLGHQIFQLHFNTDTSIRISILKRDYIHTYLKCYLLCNTDTIRISTLVLY